MLINGLEMENLIEKDFSLRDSASQNAKAKSYFAPDTWIRSHKSNLNENVKRENTFYVL